MNFIMSDTFARALERLASKDNAQANLAKQAVTDFQLNSAQPGFSLETLTKSKDPNFWSFRVSDKHPDYRPPKREHFHSLLCGSPR